MPKPRGREHTTLTETAQKVVRVLQKIQREDINPDPYFEAAAKVDQRSLGPNTKLDSDTKMRTTTQRAKQHQSKGGIKMIAPGEIRTTQRGKSGKRHITAVFTKAGMELLVTGQSLQKIAVHTSDPESVYTKLKTAKSLRDFAVSRRERKPGV